MQLDADGYSYIILYEIFGHRKIDDKIPMESRYYDTRTGVERRVTKTKEWKLKVK